MTVETDERRHNQMRKIQALLDRASNTPYEEEANAARAKADELMTLYTIESWELERHKPKGQREEPTVRMMDVCRGDHAGKDGLRRLVSAVAIHCRCKLLHYDFESKYYPYRVKLFGFPSDLDYTEMLFTNLMLQMTKDMKPEYDHGHTFEENLVRLKESGMKWVEMHPILQPGVPFERKIGVRYTGIYTKYCKEHNRERMYTSPVMFVRSFITGFAERVDARLEELRRRQLEQEEQHGPGTSLMLVDRHKEVNDFYYATRGQTKAMRISDRKLDAFARRSGQAAGDRADLGQTRVGGRKEIG